MPGSLSTENQEKIPMIALLPHKHNLKALNTIGILKIIVIVKTYSVIYSNGELLI